MRKFQDFQGPLQKFQDFPGLESKFSNSRTFQVYKDLCEPCIKKTTKRKGTFLLELLFAGEKHTHTHTHSKYL